MRLPSIPRRWLVAGGIGVGCLLLVVLGLTVIYPKVGARMIRKKVADKVEAKLGRKVAFGDVDVSLGRAVISNLEIRGPRDGATPLVRIARAEIVFDTWSSLVGKVKLGPAKVEGVTISMHRDIDGFDNVRDILDRLRGDGDASSTKRGASGPRPTQIAVTKIEVRADDAQTGSTAHVGDADATWTPDLVVANVRRVSATTTGAPRADLASIEIRKAKGAAPVVKIDGGEIALWQKMSLSGISGTIVQDPKAATGHYVLDVTGGWGGVPGKLWTAKGMFDTVAFAGSLDLDAEKFQLDRLAPILARSGIVDYASTSVDTALHLQFDRRGAQFSGDLNLSGLNVGHPMIADKEVHGLSLSANIAGSFDSATRTLELTRGDFVARDVPFSITGTIVRPRRDPKLMEFTPTPVDQKAPPMRGPHGIQVLKLNFSVPPIKCQDFLDAIPAEMAPYMQGYKVKGTFVTNVKLEIDWNALDSTVLGGSVGINKCKVVEEPDDSPKRLLEPFEHFVEYEKDEWLSFIVGPENPDFVPIDQISPNLIKSITTTEDGAFYKHHGFIVSEFRTALVSDLKAGGFRHGASSITMQMVKNVLLYREKTLARKLQELFLTWHVENTLTKDRILEIYFNVIEYGPALYGIGAATRHYFGIHPRDLTPSQAAFFSSILPSPKERYKQYCQGTLTKWTTGKIDRILALMLKREKITKEEYDKAIATPLVFVKDGSETEKACMERVKKAIKNSRSTNPLKNQSQPPENTAPESSRSTKPPKKQ